MASNSSYRQIILHVDLTRHKVWKDFSKEQDTRMFLGGRGGAAKLLFEMTHPGIAPLAEDNPLIFAVGPLTGTHAPCSGRTTVVTKSPATDFYLKTNAGGRFGVFQKLAGYDYIIVTGRATEPVYLYIDDNDVRIRPALDMWGKSIFSTNKILHDNINEDIAVASIGPAGENLVKFACIMSSYYSAFGRGGAGAVMGSKKLKAVVIAGGKGRVRIAQPVRFKQTVEEAREAIYRDSKAERLYRYGTAGSIARMNQARLLPSYNFQRSHIDEIADLDSQSWEEKGYLRGRIGCTSCILSCHRFTSVATGSHAIKYSGGPEYEAISALGTGCGVNDFSAVHEANAICNDMGLDTISTGAVIQWAMETFQKGLLGKEAVDGIDMRFGSKAAITTLPRLIAMREGIGDLLAEGTKVAAQEIGGESWKWAVQARGLEQSRVETRGAYAYALSFAVNPRGPDHLHSECLAEFGATPEAQELIERITGSKKYAMPNMTEKRAEIVRWHEDIFAVSDSLGLCAFTTTSTYGLDESICARLFRYATGVDIGAPEIMLVGRRIVTLERCYNLTEGMRGLLDQLPWRIMNERQRDLFPDRAIVSGDMLQSMLTEYYKLHGWDSNGIPTKLALAQLGLLPLVEVRDETVR